MASKKRRAKGEGYIYPRKGRYYIQLRTIDADGNRCRKWLSGGKSLFSANKALADYKEKNFICADATQTLSKWLSTWLTKYAKGKTVATISLYKQLINNHVLPYLGNKRLIDLKPVMFSTLYANLSHKLSAKTITTINSVINAAINQAINDEIIFRNVLRGVKKPATRRKQHRIFSESEAKTFRELITQSRYRFNYLLMLGAGLRIGEALAAGWDAIDTKQKTIRVFRQVTERHTIAGNTIQISQLKTERSNRVVPLPDEIIADLKSIPTSARCGFIFKGRSKSPRGMVRDFKLIVKRMGVEGMRPHDLRHTYASWLLLHGVDLPRVSELLGHSSTKVTGDTYSHVIPGSKDQARAAMAKLFTKVEAEDND